MKSVFFLSITNLYVYNYENCSHLPCLIFQQDCEELARKVADLTTENSALRAELDNLKKACQDMETENSRLLVSTWNSALIFFEKNSALIGHHHLVTLFLLHRLVSCQHV